MSIPVDERAMRADLQIKVSVDGFEHTMKVGVEDIAQVHDPERTVFWGRLVQRAFIVAAEMPDAPQHFRDEWSQRALDRKDFVRLMKDAGLSPEQEDGQLALYEARRAAR